MRVVEVLTNLINFVRFPEQVLDTFAGSMSFVWELRVQVRVKRRDGTRCVMKDVEFDTKASVDSVRVDLPGRLFVPGDECEAPCRIIELSPDGASLQCEVVPQSGSSVVLYVDGLSRFEGMIVRCDANAIEVKFVCTVAKRERTAEQIAAMRDKGLNGGSILRRHERAHRKGCTQFTCANGQIVSCEVIDISVSGVSLRTDTRPLIGEFVLIAEIAGQVSRYHEDGISIEFVGKDSAPA